MKQNKINTNDFGGIPLNLSAYNNSSIIILPVPFEKTSSWIKGSRKGPSAIINASRNMELFDIDTQSEVFRLGIHTAPEIRARDSLGMIKKVYSRTVQFIDDKKFTVVLGGEHSVSIGSIKAHNERHPRMSILHLDAHSDMRDIYEDNMYSHACTMARVREFNTKIVSVGIRSMDSSELQNIDKNNLFTAREIHRSGNWIQKVLTRLDKNVYVTIDLDVFDPSIMPSTGTPEPGGLSWFDVEDLLEAVTIKKTLVGFDVVELCPSVNVSPDFLAAKLIYRILSMKFKGTR